MEMRSSETTGPVIETSRGMVVPLARTRTLSVGRNRWFLHRSAARATKVDVIGDEGLEEVVPIHDRTRQIQIAIWLVVVVVVVVVRSRRSR